jgi:hypothetical protein
MVNFLLSGDGGIGRRAGLRSQWPQGRAGSSPVLRTTSRIRRLILANRILSQRGSRMLDTAQINYLLPVEDSVRSAVDRLAATLLG